jgi:hypothetical protein
MRLPALLSLVFLVACQHSSGSSSDGGGGTSASGGQGGGTAGVVGTAGSGGGAVGGSGGPGGGLAGAGGAAGTGTGGAAGAAGASGAGGGGTVSPDAAAATDGPSSTVDAGSCPFNMAGTACAPTGINCVFSSDCVARRCDCVAGAWVCTERQLPCGGKCPAAQDAQCGGACTGNLSNCLCHCGGGGPNYSGCSCVSNRWQCTCGR